MLVEGVGSGGGRAREAARGASLTGVRWPNDSELKFLSITFSPVPRVLRFRGRNSKQVGWGVQ